MRLRLTSLLASLALALTTTANGAFILEPLAGFGGPDGWFAPGETATDTFGPHTATYLTTDNNQRGLAFNPVTKQVLVPNGTSIRALNPLTGRSEALLDVTGLTGGARTLNAIGVTSDGVVYGANLTTNSTTSPYKVYRWATQAAVPTNVYSGNGGIAGARVGDNLDVAGAEGSGLIAAGYGSSPTPAGVNGYATLVPGLTPTATAIDFGPSAPSGAVNGDFRLGIAVVDSDSVLGTQGGTVRRNTSFVGSTGTVESSSTLTSASERGMDYTVIDGLPLLATIDTASSLVRLYDFTTPASPVLLSSLNLTSGTLSGNVNGTSAVAFGELADGTDVLYAMSTNQGIQAFLVTVPEPASAASALVGLACLGLRRRR